MRRWIAVLLALFLLVVACGRAGDLVRPEDSQGDPLPPGLETDPPYQF